MIHAALKDKAALFKMTRPQVSLERPMPSDYLGERFRDSCEHRVLHFLKRTKTIHDKSIANDGVALAGMWAERLRAYARPCTKRGILQLIVTAVPLAILWVAMATTLDYGYWIALLLSIPAAGLIVRLFMIQHDCAHYSYFRSCWANDLVGGTIGLFTLTPHKYWREAHAIHHATSGNLGSRGIGDVTTLTIREYTASPWWSRLAYRLYRNPLVLILIAPTFLFVIKFRLPLDMLLRRWSLLPNVLLHGLLIALALTAASLVLGFDTVAMVQAPITLLSATIGVWLFYVQHQFENTYWATDAVWNFHTAAFKGSSYFHMPAPLRWFTANIGAHHVHHLCTRIPNYRLPECLKRYPELQHINRLTLWQSMKCLPLTLWDEDRNRLVSFRVARRGTEALKSHGSRG